MRWRESEGEMVRDSLQRRGSTNSDDDRAGTVRGYARDRGHVLRDAERGTTGDSGALAGLDLNAIHREAVPGRGQARASRRRRRRGQSTGSLKCPAGHTAHRTAGRPAGHAIGRGCFAGGLTGWLAVWAISSDAAYLNWQRPWFSRGVKGRDAAPAPTLPTMKQLKRESGGRSGSGAIPRENQGQGTSSSRDQTEK
jgi:hypothetical protein